MLGIFIILAAIAVGITVLYVAIRAWGEVEVSIWQPLGMLAAGRFISRGLLMPFSDMDLSIRLGLSVVFYMVVIGGMLAVWTRVPPIRAALVAIGVGVFMLVASLAGALYIPER